MSKKFANSSKLYEYFEWDEEKQRINLQRHLIDFEDAITIFDAPYIRVRSDRDGEVRYLAVGMLAGIEICVIYTEREEVCRVISARRARTYERAAYHKAVKGSDP